jgi:hypothetical protein
MAHQRFLRKQSIFHLHAGVAELADAPDLGSGAARRGGSSPFTRTFNLFQKTIDITSNPSYNSVCRFKRGRGGMADALG